MKARDDRRGMTLIEIMVVVAILGMIASVVAVGVVKQMVHAREQAARLDIRGFEQGLTLYKLRHGHFPSNTDGLGVLYTEGHLEGELKKDPWGNDYVYAYPGQKHPDGFDLTSYGADGQPGGEGENADIMNGKEHDDVANR